LKGLHYTIVDANDTAARDVNIVPKATDTLVLTTGVAMSLGEGYHSASDVHSSVDIWCYDPNIWTITKETGTWTQDVP
jgi:hypothetical protein